MIRRCGDVLPDGEGIRPPILLDLFDGRKRSLREASAASLQGGFRAIAQQTLYRIREHVREVSTVKGKEKVGEYLDSLPETPDNDRIRAEYADHLVGMDPGDALAEAFWKTGYSGVGPKSVKGFPWHALLALGRRSGYLLPYDDRGRGVRSRVTGRGPLDPHSFGRFVTRNPDAKSWGQGAAGPLPPEACLLAKPKEIHYVVPNTMTPRSTLSA